MSNYRPLYPKIEPYQTGILAVGDGYQMYYEECGNPQGKPAVYVHGGQIGVLFILTGHALPIPVVGVLRGPKRARRPEWPAGSPDILYLMSLALVLAALPVLSLR